MSASVTTKMTISLDGSRILVGRRACDDGFDVSDGVRQRRSAAWDKCKPVESVIAALHDLETGRQIWSIRATGDRASEHPAHALSDDGRYALVWLPSAPPRSLNALISMNDGKIVQTLPSPGGLYSMGFLHGGRTVWTHGQGVTAFYDVRA